MCQCDVVWNVHCDVALPQILPYSRALWWRCLCSISPISVSGCHIYLSDNSSPPKKKSGADWTANPTWTGLSSGFCSLSISLAKAVTSHLIGLIIQLPDGKIPQYPALTLPSAPCYSDRSVQASRRAATWTGEVQHGSYIFAVLKWKSQKVLQVLKQLFSLTLMGNVHCCQLWPFFHLLSHKTSGVWCCNFSWCEIIRIFFFILLHMFCTLSARTVCCFASICRRRWVGVRARLLVGYHCLCFCLQPPSSELYSGRIKAGS